jgi:hypothetical protein
VEEVMKKAFFVVLARAVCALALGTTIMGCNTPTSGSGNGISGDEEEVGGSLTCTTAGCVCLICPGEGCPCITPPLPPSACTDGSCVCTDCEEDECCTGETCLCPPPVDLHIVEDIVIPSMDTIGSGHELEIKIAIVDMFSDMRDQTDDMTYQLNGWTPVGAVQEAFKAALLSDESIIKTNLVPLYGHTDNRIDEPESLLRTTATSIIPTQLLAAYVLYISAGQYSAEAQPLKYTDAENGLIALGLALPALPIDETTISSIVDSLTGHIKDYLSSFGCPSVIVDSFLQHYTDAIQIKTFGHDAVSNFGYNLSTLDFSGM